MNTVILHKTNLNILGTALKGPQQHNILDLTSNHPEHIYIQKSALLLLVLKSLSSSLVLLVFVECLYDLLSFNLPGLIHPHNKSLDLMNLQGPLQTLIIRIHIPYSPS